MKRFQIFCVSSLLILNFLVGASYSQAQELESVNPETVAALQEKVALQAARLVVFGALLEFELQEVTKLPKDLQRRISSMGKALGSSGGITTALTVGSFQRGLLTADSGLGVISSARGLGAFLLVSTAGYSFYASSGSSHETQSSWPTGLATRTPWGTRLADIVDLDLALESKVRRLVDDLAYVYHLDDASDREIFLQALTHEVSRYVIEGSPHIQRMYSSSGRGHTIDLVGIFGEVRDSSGQPLIPARVFQVMAENQKISGSVFLQEKIQVYLSEEDRKRLNRSYSADEILQAMQGDDFYNPVLKKGAELVAGVDEIERILLVLREIESVEELPLWVLEKVSQMIREGQRTASLARSVLRKDH